MALAGAVVVVEAEAQMSFEYDRQMPAVVEVVEVVLLRAATAAHIPVVVAELAEGRPL